MRGERWRRGGSVRGFVSCLAHPPPRRCCAARAPLFLGYWCGRRGAGGVSERLGSRRRGAPWRERRARECCLCSAQALALRLKHDAVDRGAEKGAERGNERTPISSSCSSDLGHSAQGRASSRQSLPRTSCWASLQAASKRLRVNETILSSLRSLARWRASNPGNPAAASTRSFRAV